MAGPATPSDWVHRAPPVQGLERIEAYFAGHGYDMHRHDTYAIGRTLRGVQSFQYRGGWRHSLPGATMALLAAEYDDEWAGVVSVGPVTDPRIYGTDDYLPIAKDDEKGAQLRAPVNWLASIKNPTFVIEGDGRGNLVDLEEMRGKNNNPQVRFIIGKGCDHFSVLRPASSIVADAIVNRQFGAIADNKSFETLCR